MFFYFCSILCAFIAFLSQPVYAQEPSQNIKLFSGNKYFKKFYKANKGRYPAHYQFEQYNEHFKRDSLYGTSVWFEEIKFPNYFKIQMGHNNGNYVIYQQDSAYRYEYGMLKEKKYSPNRLLFMNGGFSHYDYKTCLQKLQAYGININIGYLTDYEGQKVIVVGALPNDFTKNQWWVDAKTFQIVRIIYEVAPKTMMRLEFKKFEQIGKQTIEKEVWIYVNEVLNQKEYYKNIKIVP